MKFAWDLLFEICNLLTPVWFRLVRVRMLAGKTYTVIIRKSKLEYVAICLELKYSDEEIAKFL